MRSCSGGKAVFLSRNLRMLPDHLAGHVTSRKAANGSQQQREQREREQRDGRGVTVASASAAETTSGAQQPLAQSGPTQSGQSTAEKDATDALIDTLERKLNEKGPPQRVNNVANSGIIANDQTQCKIIAANKKMLFIVSKDNFLYKRDCLTKAKKVRTDFLISFEKSLY